MSLTTTECVIEQAPARWFSNDLPHLIGEGGNEHSRSVQEIGWPATDCLLDAEQADRSRPSQRRVAPASVGRVDLPHQLLRGNVWSQQRELSI